jgi:hypothetical protein
VGGYDEGENTSDDAELSCDLGDEVDPEGTGIPMGIVLAYDRLLGVVATF